MIQPAQGIPRRGTLSSFFGAIYLRPLDLAFEKRNGVLYVRFMDDILILTQTKRQYRRARKDLTTILSSLKLTLSPHKTKMGQLTSGFHFLGMFFQVAQTPEGKIQTKTVIHQRSCQRALDKVIAMTDFAVDPVQVQQYLLRWARWWYSASSQNKHCTVRDNLQKWLALAQTKQPSLVWAGYSALMQHQGLHKATCTLALSSSS